MRGSYLNVEIFLYPSVRELEISRFQPLILIQGRDILLKSLYVKDLPLRCFDDVGGKKRLQLRDLEPNNNTKYSNASLQRKKPGVR